jgi:hypothetical protein
VIEKREELVIYSFDNECVVLGWDSRSGRREEGLGAIVIVIAIVDIRK